MSNPEENNPSDSPGSSGEPHLDQAGSPESISNLLQSLQLFQNPGFQAEPSDLPSQKAIDSLLQKSEDQQKKIDSQQKRIEEQQEKIDSQQKRIESQQGAIDDLKNRVDATVTESRETRGLVVFGFIVVVIMVGGMVWTAINERINRYDSMVEKLYSYQEKTDSLQEQVSSRAIVTSPEAQPLIKVKKGLFH